MSLRACLPVCLSVYLSLFVCRRPDIFGTTRPIFIMFHVTHGCACSVVLLQRCDKLCTSGFMDNVMFTHNRWPGIGHVKQGQLRTGDGV